MSAIKRKLSSISVICLLVWVLIALHQLTHFTDVEPSTSFLEQGGPSTNYTLVYSDSSILLEELKKFNATVFKTPVVNISSRKGKYNFERIGIVCYVPARKSLKYLEEMHHFLLPSVRYVSEYAMVHSINVRIDLLVATDAFNAIGFHPNCVWVAEDSIQFRPNTRLNKVPKDTWGCYVFKTNDVKEYISKQTFFLYSLRIFLDMKFTQFFYFYDWIFRTDVDVFISPLFLKIRPRHAKERVLTGHGAYSPYPNTTYCLGEFAKEMSEDFSTKILYGDNPKINVGTSWFGKPHDIRNLGAYSFLFSAWIFVKGFEPTFRRKMPSKVRKICSGGWPIWHQGVSTMYGSEIALNHLFNNSAFVSWVYDTDTAQMKIYPIYNKLAFPLDFPAALHSWPANAGEAPGDAKWFIKNIYRNLYDWIKKKTYLIDWSDKSVWHKGANYAGAIAMGHHPPMDVPWVNREFGVCLNVQDNEQSRWSLPPFNKTLCS